MVKDSHTYSSNLSLKEIMSQKFEKKSFFQWFVFYGFLTFIVWADLAIGNSYRYEWYAQDLFDRGTPLIYLLFFFLNMVRYILTKQLISKQIKYVFIAEFLRQLLLSMFYIGLFLISLSFEYYLGLILLFGGLMTCFIWLVLLSQLNFRLWRPNSIRNKIIKENETKLEQSEIARDLAIKYIQLRVPTLKESINDLTPKNIDDKVYAVLNVDIERFQNLLELNEIEIESISTLTEFTFGLTEPFRNDLRSALKQHLTNQLLVNEEERVFEDIGSMIDALIDQYEKMEDTGFGKV